MPVELLVAGGGWLLKEAVKFAAGTWDKVREDREEEAAKRIRTFIEGVSGAGARNGDATSETQPDVVTQGVAAGEVAAKDQESAEALQEKLGVELSSALTSDATGTDAWLVRAYEAVLWRLAVVAVWEQRPVAVAGALQGRDWLTVCDPRRVGGVPKPLDMWTEAAGPGLRRPRRQPPVEFFVWPGGDGTQLSDEDVAGLNLHLSRDGFSPGRPAGPDDVKVCHRIDGLYAHWVALQPDSQTGARIDNATGVPDLFNPGRRFGVIPNQPLDYRQYPNDWQELLNIDTTEGLDALGRGIDKFAESSAGVRQAVEGLFGGVRAG